MTTKKSKYSTLECNMRHILPEDFGFLMASTTITSRPHSHGALICLPENGSKSGISKLLKQEHFSITLVELILLARSKRCQCINLDQNGPFHRELKDMAHRWEGSLKQKQTCPICAKGTLIRSVRKEIFTYKGRKCTIPDYVTFKCTTCKESIVEADSLKKSGKILKKFRNKVDSIQA